jgi:hypothetical protein
MIFFLVSDEDFFVDAAPDDAGSHNLGKSSDIEPFE